ncbi:DUF2769 domain-containing protein [Methanovulcanius yangii]|uniref:DUF2769 domain-containing protein n=1 Tax=Methanovulcanius yangii TaxID=1789227 RepID=UPI0029CA63A0|nr:DUF2769 domain-containing protein [Methanovulcanius yangii]
MEDYLELAKRMEEMSPEEQEEMMAMIREMCICAGCASYTSCMKEKGELMFCATGKSECFVEMKQCLCPECPATSKMGLINTSYCMQGSEKELRGL